VKALFVRLQAWLAPAPALSHYFAAFVIRKSLGSGRDVNTAAGRASPARLIFLYSVQIYGLAS